MEAPPVVYKAVRAVGVLRPTLQAAPLPGQAFADRLDVRGTAFWVKSAGVLVTCAHVIQDLVVVPIEIAGLLVVGNGNGYHRATIGSVDFDHDLAILRLPPETPPDIVERELKDGLEIGDGIPSVGSKVAYAGFPFGTLLLSSTHAPTYSEGVVGSEIRQGQDRRAPYRREIQVSGSVAGGFSGAPIVSTDAPAKVIGVLSNSPSASAGQASIFMGVSHAHLQALADLARS
jgi:hypothetical protein